jgi:hypothetical protein
LLCAILGGCSSGVAAFVPTQQRPLFGSSSGSRLRATTAATAEFALLFDCDGVILETEELHRVAYNEAFRKFDLTIDGEPVVWTVSCISSYR